MFPRYAFFDVAAFLLLWPLSVSGAAALCFSLMFAKTDYEDGVLSRNSYYLITTRALLAAACIIFWTFTCLGHVLTPPDKNFWVLGRSSRRSADYVNPSRSHVGGLDTFLMAA
jgi:hypothetical protein